MANAFFVAIHLALERLAKNPYTSESVLNAEKYTENSGKIRIKVRPKLTNVKPQVLDLLIKCQPCPRFHLTANLCLHGL